MIRFEIPGIPQQQGSKRHVGRGIMIETNRNLAPWRDSAIYAAKQVAGPGHTPITDPVLVIARFIFPRPKGHYGTGRNANQVKDSAPAENASAPDLDKLQRALGDALTQSGTIRDDRLIYWWDAQKSYGDTPHTTVMVVPAEHLTVGAVRAAQDVPEVTR